jgi:Carboxypeptidase regulatory-like domain
VVGSEVSALSVSGEPGVTGSATPPAAPAASASGGGPGREPAPPTAVSGNGRPGHGPSAPAGATPLVALSGPATVPARVVGRLRRPAAELAEEHAAADQALQRTFGVGDRAACPPAPPAPAATQAGPSQPVAVHVVGRDGAPLAGATVTLHDDQGRETASATTGPDGRGALTAPRPGGYVLVTAAPGHQPAAAALTVTDEPVAAPVQLTRAASLAGTVSGEGGPQVGARVVLAQDGELVAATETDAEGGYRIGDLAPGPYALSVTAPECEPAAVAVHVADAQDARADVELAPAGLPVARG